MGYYTYYNLDLYGKDEDVERCEESFRKELSGVGYCDDEIEGFLDGDALEAKGSCVESICETVAKTHPDVLIVLSGDGECSDDLWEARFKGDLYERQDFTIPPFTTPELQIPD